MLFCLLKNENKTEMKNSLQKNNNQDFKGQTGYYSMRATLQTMHIVYATLHSD